MDEGTLRLPATHSDVVEVETLLFSFFVLARLTYNIDYGRISDEFVAHDDVVSCLSLVDDDDGDVDGERRSTGLLVSGSWDCSVK